MSRTMSHTVGCYCYKGLLLHRKYQYHSCCETIMQVLITNYVVIHFIGNNENCPAFHVLRSKCKRDVVCE